MDHAEEDIIESGGRNHKIQHHRVGDDPPLRGNSTVPTAEDLEEPAAINGGESMDMEVVDVAGGAADGSTDTSSEIGLSLALVARPEMDASAPLPTMSTTSPTAPAQAGGGDSIDQQPPVGAADPTHHEVLLTETLQNGESQTVGEAAASADAIHFMDVSEDIGSNHQLFVEQSSFDLVQELSAANGYDDDEDDYDDILSDKASSFDANSDSDAFLPLHDDHMSPSLLRNDRAPLEKFYGPFINPTDTCLADARERLHVALEQTRLLGASFTEQAYVRYRCVMKPVPESLEEIIEPIISDPDQAAADLLEQTKAIKVEKEMEKSQAQQAGVGLEELAYFGEGLHLVILPEDDVDESDLDVVQFPHRGPTNPETGERVEEISASAAATTEQVFGRIRRIRAIRAGADIREAGLPQEVAKTTNLTRNLPQDQHVLNESFSSGFAAASHLTSSPAQSVDSLASHNHHHLKGSLQHLLTLAPDAEGVRPDGTYPAVRSALMARGVGMHEMKHDHRVNPLHQRLLQPNYFSPTPAHTFLPPLLDPNQLHRLKATDARRNGIKYPSGARESIRSVVDEIFAAAGGSGMESAGKFVNKDDGKIDDSSNIGCGEGAFGQRKVPYEERSALETRLLWRMHSRMRKSRRPVVTSSTSEPTTELGMQRPTSEDDYIDPTLAFSVMNAVGLVRKKTGNVKNPSQFSVQTTEIQALGLDSLSGLVSVSNFFQTISAKRNQKKRPLPSTNGDVNDAKTAKHNGDNTDEVILIRGGGGQDEISSVVPQIMWKDPGGNNMSAKTDTPTIDPSLCESIPIIFHSQAVIAGIAAPTQYHQSSVHSDSYHTATLPQQLTLPIGSPLSSLQYDALDKTLHNGIAENLDWTAHGIANPGAMAVALAQHPQLARLKNPDQNNVAVVEQDAAIAIQQNVETTGVLATQGVTTSSGALCETALSSIDPQITFDSVASSQFQDLSNKTQSISSLPELCAKQQTTMTSKVLQREKIPSLFDVAGTKDTNVPDTVEQCISEDMASTATDSPQLISDLTIHGPPIHQKSFTMPAPPEGLHQDVADLIARAKFHDARSLSRSKYDEPEALLMKFLLSLSASIPIPKQFIADQLVQQLGSANNQLRLNRFVGCSSSALASRNVIVAIISIWLWVGHKDFFDHSNVETGGEDSSLRWHIILAVDLCLTALANYFNAHPTDDKDCPTKDSLDQQVAAIASESLSKQVVFDPRTDASFSMLEDLLNLLDSLRTDALRAKTQERVLLASLASRCGNMTEAFSNAYVSSIVRAGVALGHEHVCELGQDEACGTSTLMPFDYFHDNMGIWEEPCRPANGYNTARGGDELKKLAHARSLIQKSMMRLQHRLGLKGGISDGGPYNVEVPPKNSSSTPQTPTGAPSIVRTPSGQLKRRGTNDLMGATGTGDQDTTFNPDHIVEPMLFNTRDVENFPYGQHPLGVITAGSLSSEYKRRKLSHSEEDNLDAAALRFRSTQELEWDDVANMFFHGGNTRGVDVDYDFSSNDQLGKRNIFAPFVRAFDRSNFRPERSATLDSDFDEDINDEAVLQRHNDALQEMKLKLDAAIESRKQSSQQRGRKR